MDIVLNIEAEIPKKPVGIRNRLRAWWASILRDKLSKPGVLIFFSIFSLISALLIYAIGSGAAVLILGAVAIIPIIYGVVVYPKFGIVVLFVAAYLLFIPMKMDTHGFPLGTVMDALEYLLILGFFIKQKKDRRWSLFHDKLSFMILLWVFYNILEVLNPESESMLEWVYTIRTTAIIILMYFVFVYQIRDVNFIKLLFKIWIGLAVLGALNGLKQEYIGYSSAEASYLYDDAGRVGLLFIDGHMRRFSIFSDPVAFAYNMASASVLCITLMLGPIKTYKKFILLGLVLLFMFSMLFSGTRGAYPLIPAAIGLLAILNFNKRVLVFVSVTAVIFLGFILMPTTNPTIARFQTAFRPSNDASFNVREVNQQNIRPYIQAHPFGGGLGSTGQWGKRFAPDSFLAKFPPDSGYVRVAVELGTIGLTLLCILVFIALYGGINNYYLIKDPTLKNYCLASTLIVFMYNIGNYPQEAIVQFPSNIIFFLVMALIPVCYRIDREMLAKAQNGK